MILRNGKRIDGCSDTVPIGSLNPFLGTTAPYGYLICAGQLVSKITYPELYAICGNTYGTATATEFYLPDLRGRTIVGYKEGDSNFGTLGGLVGSVTSATGNHTLTVDEIPSHKHNVGYAGNLYYQGGNTSWWTGGLTEENLYTDTKGTEYAGGGGAHNHGNVSTIQPSINLNWIVKAFMLMPNQSYVATTEQESDTNTYSCNYINENFIKSDIIYIGSQMLYDKYSFTYSNATTENLLGVYDYDLITGVFDGIVVPSGFHKEYKLTFQGTNNNSALISVGLNNIFTNGIFTYSGGTFRKIAGSALFKESDIILEATMNYSRQGVNLKIKTDAGCNGAVYGITIHGYLVRD